MLWQKNKDLALQQKRQKTGKRKSLLSKFYFNFSLMIVRQGGLFDGRQSALTFSSLSLIP